MISPIRRWGPLAELADDPAVDDALTWGFVLVATAQICTYVVLLRALPSVLPRGVETSGRAESRGYKLLAAAGVSGILLTAIYWILVRLSP